VPAELALLADDGSTLPLHLERWHGRLLAEDLDLLDRVRSPVVDLGCGPGRHVVALNARGVPALGIDAAPNAVATARARGAPVLERSIFDRIPGFGRWGTALLLDGNVGISGDPVALLGRARALLAAGGNVLVEVAEPGVRTRTLRVRVLADDALGPPFPWAVVGADDIAAMAEAAGLVVADVWEGGGRWFAELERP
jgi:SAM-dependent methyltransferase